MINYSLLKNFSTAELQTMLDNLIEQSSLDNKRLTLLQATATRTPSWQGYNPMIDDFVTINSYIEQFQTVCEDNFYDSSLLRSIIDRRNGLNQTIKMF